jgi:hypothetical protein
MTRPSDARTLRAAMAASPASGAGAPKPPDRKPGATRGTEGSNPAPSTGESCANLTFGGASIASRAPNAQVSIYPWKANPEQIQLALRHVRAFLKANRPAAAAAQPLAAAAQ